MAAAGVAAAGDGVDGDVAAFEALCAGLVMQPTPALAAELDALEASPHAVPLAQEVLRRYRGAHAAQGEGLEEAERRRNAVCFFAVALLRGACLRQWEHASPDDVAGLQSYVWDVLFGNSGGGGGAGGGGDGEGAWSGDVLGQLTQTIAVFAKRGWLDAGGAGAAAEIAEAATVRRLALVERATATARVSPWHMETVARLLREVLGEFSRTRIASAIALPVEFHQQAHAIFEQEALLPCFRVVLDMLEFYLSPACRQQLGAAAHVSGIAHTLEVAVDILSWEFGATFGAAQAPTTGSAAGTTAFGVLLFDPGVAWREVLIREELIALAGRAFDVICERQGEDTAAPFDAAMHSARQLLIQLASFTGSVFADRSQTLGYAELLCPAALQLLQQRPLNEVKYAAQFLLRYFANFEMHLLSEVSTLDQLLSAFAASCQELTQAVCQEAHNVQNALATAGHSAGDDPGQLAALAAAEGLAESWQADALRMVLDAWVMLIQDPFVRVTSAQEITAHADPAELQRALGYANFVASLTPPLYEGMVQAFVLLHVVDAMACADDEEEEEAEEIAEGEVEDRIMAVSCIGRSSFASAVQVIGNHLGGDAGVVQRLQSTLQQHQSPQHGASDTESLSPGVLAVLEECRLWTLAAAQLLCSRADGEEAVIPAQILIFMRLDPDAHTVTVQQTRALVQLLAELFHVLVDYACTAPTDPMASPILANTALEAFHLILCSYVNTNLETYAAEDVQAVAELAGVVGMPSDASTAATAQQQGHEPAQAQRLGLQQRHLLDDGPQQRQEQEEQAQQQLAHATELAELLLGGAWRLLNVWPFQEEVVLSACNVLLECAKFPFVHVVARTNAWTEVGAGVIAFGAPEGTDVAGLRAHMIPGHSRTRLFEAVFAIAANAGDEARLMHLVSEFLAGFESTAQNLHAAGSAAELDDKAILQCQNTLLELRGVVRAIDRGQVDPMISVLCEASQKCLPQLAIFVERLVSASCACRSDMFLLLLSVLQDIAEFQLATLDMHSAALLYDACGRTLSAYMSSCSPTSESGSSSERDQPRQQQQQANEEQVVGEMVAICQVLSSIMATAYHGLAIDADTAHQQQLYSLPDAVNMGMTALLGQVTDNILTYPSLATVLFPLLCFFAELFPELVSSLPQDTGGRLMQLLMVGARDTQTQTARSSLQAIGALLSTQVEQTVEASAASTPATPPVVVVADPEALKALVEDLLDLVARHNPVWDRIDACASALWPCIMLSNDVYTAVANSFVSQLAAVQDVQAQVYACFEALVVSNDIRMDMSKANRRIFRQNLKQFTSRIRALLPPS